MPDQVVATNKLVVLLGELDLGVSRSKVEDTSLGFYGGPFHLFREFGLIMACHIQPASI